jgi:hypothetical protein|tara:strand:- start:1047 stop:1334 length:288 start_codon:yes stop_codon:yes gene_type:complete
MKLFKSLFIGITCLLIVSCDKEDLNPDNIEITGIIKEQDMTTYQYGTHTLSGYALRSNTVSLDDYVNQNVTIVGYKVNEYPVDGGPYYIEVEKIK